MNASRRQLGNSGLMVSSVGFGCWPIAGVSSLGVNDSDSLATLHAAIEGDINFFDTAYAYGFDGEADKLLAQAIAAYDRRDLVLASKVGTYFDRDRQRVVDGSPETLLRHAKEIVDRLGVGHVDVMYLHQPDPAVPLDESASAIAEIVGSGLATHAGVSNVDAEQLREFHRACPVVVVQPPYNMLQPETVNALLPACRELGIAIACYWVLMKGLLAGKMQRDHQFDPADKRLSYPIYQGAAWERAQDLLDVLRDISQELGCTVAQLVTAWTLQQPGITVALLGAKRASQIQETIGAMHLTLDEVVIARINFAAGLS